VTGVTGTTGTLYIIHWHLVGPTTTATLVVVAGMATIGIVQRCGIVRREHYSFIPVLSAAAAEQYGGT